MAVLITVRVKGDPKSLVAGYNAVADYEESRVAELRCHVCAKTDDGLLITGVWESRESFERLLGSSEFRKILEDHRMPPPEIEILEVYRSRH